MTGHCYVACEAIYHLLGGKEGGLRPMFIYHEGSPHWYLMRGDEVIDPTASQFRSSVPYEFGKGKGFLTKKPSRRAAVVIDRALNKFQLDTAM
jgi:hypothetical protein